MTCPWWQRVAGTMTVVVAASLMMGWLRDRVPDAAFFIGSIIVLGVVAGLLLWIAWPWLQRYVRRGH